MKPKVRMGLCYPSGSGGMFLTELLYHTPIEESGNYPTNPGCHRNITHNEYGGARECVFVDNTEEALDVNESSILVAKLNIHKYLPYYDCPITYQIDVSDDESFHFTQELFYMKKYLGRVPEYEEQFKDHFERVGFLDVIKDFDSIHPFSKASSDIVRTIKEKGYNLSKELVTSCVRTFYREYMERGESARFTNKERWDRNTNVDRSSVYYPEEISKYSELKVINYADLFLKGKKTGTLFDNFSDEIEEYTERNYQLIETFEREFL
jgi:hypothetical protein